MKLGDRRERLMSMIEDALWAENILEKEDNQFTRRAYIRSLFSMIEGAVWVLKQTVLLAPTSNGNIKKFTAVEYALLSDKTYELKSNGEPKVQTKYLKLPENFRFTFKILGKYFRINLNIGVGTVAWENFLQIQKVRNRITHPKTPTDFEVSDKEIDITKEVCSWFNELIFGFFNSLVTKTDGNGSQNA